MHPVIQVGDEVKVTRVDGRTFTGRLRSTNGTSVVLDVSFPSRSVTKPTVERLVRIASAAVQSVEPFSRSRGLTE